MYCLDIQHQWYHLKSLLKLCMDFGISSSGNSIILHEHLFHSSPERAGCERINSGYIIWSDRSSGFDSLSSTFSRIVSLVIRLERVEKKANKWNLFDSEKYINSLRSDIVEPLKSLRTFLEVQKGKLQSSQDELQKVRIWGEWTDPSLRSGWQEQGELSSKRAESLIPELDENINKIDAMIGKMR